MFPKSLYFADTIAQMVRLGWRGYPAGFIGLILIDVAQGLIPLGTAWLLKALFDVIAQGTQQGISDTLIQSVTFLLVAQVILLVVSQSVSPVSSYLNAELARRLTLKVQVTIYEKINSLVGLAPFEDPRFQDTIQLAARGSQLGPTQSVRLLSGLLRNAITLVSFLGVLISFNPLLAGLVGLAVLPRLYSELKMGSQRFGLTSANSPKERRASYYIYVLSDIGFAKEIRLFDLGGYFLQAFYRTYQDIHQAQRNQQKHELRWQIILNSFSSVVAGVAFVLVVLQALTGSLSIGDIMLYTSAVISVQGSLGNLIVALSNLKESTMFYTRFTDLLALSQPLSVVPSPQPVPQLQQCIELCNVSFRYNDQQAWILSNVNLVIPAGQCVALVGLNGAGKTTLVKLLLRLYDPKEGTILWDGIDIREFEPQELRLHISAIFQDFMRYDLTVLENIGLGNVRDINNTERARKAAMQAGIHNTIDRLPQNYDTILSHRLAGDAIGTDLSGGEWQKIAMARMFMRDADMLILDEPTASLDAEAEYDIHNRFVELTGSRTSLLIAHRFSTVRMADAIAVLEGGRIIEYGSHNELLLLNGRYASLYGMQSALYSQN
jgi:ATP-binding cassette subfamily B protein